MCLFLQKAQKKLPTPEAESLSDPCPQLECFLRRTPLMEVDVNIPVEMDQGEQVDQMQDLSESKDELDAITGDLSKMQPLRIRIRRIT